MTRFLTASMFAAACLIFLCPVSGPAQDDAEPSQIISDDSETTWRHTRFGWEDSRYWEPVTDLRPEPVPGMHPLAWAGLLTLSVLVMLVWASEEDEVARLAPSLITSQDRRDESETTIVADGDEQTLVIETARRPGS